MEGKSWVIFLHRLSPGLNPSIHHFNIYMVQVQASGWIHWAKRDVTEELDYCQLDKLFSAEGDERKKPNLSQCVI